MLKPGETVRVAAPWVPVAVGVGIVAVVLLGFLELIGLTACVGLIVVVVLSGAVVDARGVGSTPIAITADEEGLTHLDWQDAGQLSLRGPFSFSTGLRFVPFAWLRKELWCEVHQNGRLLVRFTQWLPLWRSPPANLSELEPDERKPEWGTHRLVDLYVLLELAAEFKQAEAKQRSSGRVARTAHSRKRRGANSAEEEFDDSDEPVFAQPAAEAVSTTDGADVDRPAAEPPSDSHSRSEPAALRREREPAAKRASAKRRNRSEKHGAAPPQGSTPQSPSPSARRWQTAAAVSFIFVVFLNIAVLIARNSIRANEASKATTTSTQDYSGRFGKLLEAVEKSSKERLGKRAARHRQGVSATPTDEDGATDSEDPGDQGDAAPSTVTEDLLLRRLTECSPAGGQAKAPGTPVGTRPLDCDCVKEWIHDDAHLPQTLQLTDAKLREAAVAECGGPLRASEWLPPTSPLQPPVSANQYSGKALSAKDRELMGLEYKDADTRFDDESQEIAKRLAPGFPRALEFLARARFAKGDVAGGIDQLERAIAAGWNDYPAFAGSARSGDYDHAAGGVRFLAAARTLRDRYRSAPPKGEPPVWLPASALSRRRYMAVFLHDELEGVNSGLPLANALRRQGVSTLLLPASYALERARAVWSNDVKDTLQRLGEALASQPVRDTFAGERRNVVLFGFGTGADHVVELSSLFRAVVAIGRTYDPQTTKVGGPAAFVAGDVEESDHGSVVQLNSGDGYELDWVTANLAKVLAFVDRASTSPDAAATAPAAADVASP